MATIGNERYLRYILLLGEGGTYILLAILERETQKEKKNSGKTLDDLLKDNEQILKQWTKRKQQEKLFPTSGIVDTKQWDISLLGTVILQLFENCLTPAEYRYIKQLKELRNSYPAHPPSLSMDVNQYENARKEVASLLIQLSNTLDRSVHDRCQDLIKRFITGSIDIQTAIEGFEADKMLLETIHQVSERVEEIAEKVNVMSNNTDKIEEVKQLLQQRIHEQDNTYTFPVLGTRIILKGPNDPLTRHIEDAITALFEKVLKRIGGDTDKSSLGRALMGIVDDIKQLDDSEPSMDNNCIRLTVKCKTCDGLIQLLEYLQGNVFMGRLLDMVLAVEDEFEGLFHITFEIERESIDEIIHYVEEEAELKYPSVASLEDRRIIHGSAMDVSDVSRNMSASLPDSGQVNLSIEEQNEALLGDILDVLESPDYESPEVILLIGRSGSGKSALINTLHKVLTGKYYLIAKSGSGEASQVTMDLNRYKNCGAQLYRISDKSKKERMKGIIPKLPHVMDCVGLKDENTGKLVELLELLIGGYIPPGTNIVHLANMQEEYGEGCLQTVYGDPNPEWKVTKIVFLQGCIDAIPANLIECLKHTLAIVDKDCGKTKYRVGVFVLITKYDLVKDSKDTSLHGKDQKKSISGSALDELETDLARRFNFLGDIESYIIRWVSLSDNVGLDNPHVENVALKFLKRMVEPGVPDDQYISPVLNMRRRVKLARLRLRKNIRELFRQNVQINLSRLLILVAVMVMILAIMVYLLRQTLETTSTDTKGNIPSGENSTNVTKG